jgi:hypothetical protein
MTSPLAAAIARKHPEIDEVTVDTITRAVVLEVHMLAIERALMLRARGDVGDAWRRDATFTFGSLVFRAGHAPA